MKISKRGLNLITQFEGFSAKAYLCPAGYLTIGYGQRIPDEYSEQILTKAKALEMLEGMCNILVNKIAILITVEITQNMLDAIISLCYNIGIGAFAKSTLLKKLNNSDFTGAANEFLRWDKAGGKVLPGLSRRRKAEYDLFVEV